MYVLGYKRGSSGRIRKTSITQPLSFATYVKMPSSLKSTAQWYALTCKHRLKVGEPGFPVAAAEQGRRVIVRDGTTFEVGDGDFTLISTETKSWLGLNTLFLKCHLQ